MKVLVLKFLRMTLMRSFLEVFKNDTNAKFSVLNDHFSDFEAKYEIVNSNLSISRRFSDLLLERITQLERNNLNNA